MARTTIEVIGGDLFRLALQYLGDATQWNRIAELNGLVDPILPTGRKLALIMPDVDAAAGGGIYGNG